MLVDDLEQGLAVVDAYAAEHLEIHTRSAHEIAARVTNAGAIFIGPYAPPVPLGDYSAGSTHVLPPTAGAAAHSSGLNVKSFLKQVNLIDYSQAALGGDRRVGRGVRRGGGSARARGLDPGPIRVSGAETTAGAGGRISLSELPLRPELVGGGALRGGTPIGRAGLPERQ